MSQTPEGYGPIHLKIHSPPLDPRETQSENGGSGGSASPSSLHNLFRGRSPVNATSPLVKRKSNERRSGAELEGRSSLGSRFLNSAQDVVRRKLTRNGDKYNDNASPCVTPNLSDEEGEEDVKVGHSRSALQHIRNGVLRQIRNAETPLLQKVRHSDSLPEMSSDANDSDDDNAEADGLLSSLLVDVKTLPAIDREISIIKTELEVQIKANSMNVMKHLESSSNSDVQTTKQKQAFDDRNKQYQKHIQRLHRNLKSLEKRRQNLVDQEGPNPTNEDVEKSSAKGPETQRRGIYSGVKKAVARKKRPYSNKLRKTWGSDSALNDGVIELSESLTSDHSNKDGPTAAQLADLDDNELMSDEEEHLEKEDDEDEYISDRNDSASNLSEPVTESLEKLKCAFSDMSTTITGLQREQENCKHKLQEDIQRVIIIRNQVQQEMEDQMYILHGEINTLRNQLNDDIEQLKYKSDERIRDLEDQLEKHKTAVALLEDRQAELPSDDIIPNDIRTRWRDLMSSLITLGLAVLSFLLFLFTTIVDFVKIFSENNALSTGLSLALFAVIIAAYYYFDTASRTMQS